MFIHNSQKKKWQKFSNLRQKWLWYNQLRNYLQVICTWFTWLVHASILKATVPLNERHDTGELYHKLKIKQLQDLSPHFDWLTYFNLILPVEVSEDEDIVSFSTSYMHEMSRLINNTESRWRETDIVVLFNTSSPFLLPVEFFTTTSSSAWSTLGSKFYRSRSKTSKTDTSKFYSWGSTSSLAVQEPWTGALAAFVCREPWAIFRIGVDALCLQITTWAWRWVGCSLRITSMLRVRRVPCTWSQQSNKPSQVCVRFTSSFHADSAQVDWSESTTILNFRDLGWSWLDGWSY